MRILLLALVLASIGRADALPKNAFRMTAEPDKQVARSIFDVFKSPQAQPEYPHHLGPGWQWDAAGRYWYRIVPAPQQPFCPDGVCPLPR